MRVLTFYIAIGIAFAGASVLAKPVDFVTDVKPILEMNCVSCHNAEHAAENRIDMLEVVAEVELLGDLGVGEIFLHLEVVLQQRLEVLLQEHQRSGDLVP